MDYDKAIRKALARGHKAVKKGNVKDAEKWLNEAMWCLVVLQIKSTMVYRD